MSETMPDESWLESSPGVFECDTAFSARLFFAHFGFAEGDLPTVAGLEALTHPSQIPIPKTPQVMTSPSQLSLTFGGTAQYPIAYKVTRTLGRTWEIERAGSP